MTPIEFTKRLFQIDVGSSELAALGDDLADHARYPARLAVQTYLSSADEGLQRMARIVLVELGELAIVPMAEGAPMPNASSESWSIQLMSDEFVEFRYRAVSLLRDLLNNRRVARAVPAESGEEFPGGARVCDIAFVLLYRLLHLGSVPEDFFVATPAERSRRIKKLQASGILSSEFEDDL